MKLQNLAGALLVCSILCLLVSGCSNQIPLAKVGGTVTYNGQPLKQGAITFLPDKGPSANGKIVNGKIIDVSVHNPSDGAPLGNCKISIVSFENPNPDMYTPKNSLIPEKYNQAETSGLSAEIQSGANDLKLELKD